MDSRLLLGLGAKSKDASSREVSAYLLPARKPYLATRVSDEYGLKRQETEGMSLSSEDTCRHNNREWGILRGVSNLGCIWRVKSGI